MHATKKINLACQVMVVAALVWAAVPTAHADAGGCLIISEVVMGAESGGNPRWIEIVNTGTSDFTFTQGGIVVQMDTSNDVLVDVDLSGVTIMPGQPFVVCSTAGGAGGAFYGIYGEHADLYTEALFGDGNDRYILTDTSDGSNLLDIYGEFGVDGTGTAWEYSNGYAYRMPDYNSGNGGTFDAGEWTFGGVDSLLGDPMLMLMYTDPGRHIYNDDCVACPGDLNGDGSVNLSDLAQLLGSYGMTSGAEYEDGDMDGDGDVDLSDLAALLGVYGTDC